ncbi:MAG: TIGR03087 family PEP-CTERM/XrtA system glycosyltransferase [Acidovorax sp.]|uniref:TIGR03087 family PEP-CTERM/XrtA system glycosyltransferase n=1 Tax=Acidovorax sp. TaxID=1872122 RepID=UPI00391BB0E7
MGNVLFLAHRMPYPPNKGDKVRSYHLLRHLQQHHRVFLGTFIDTHDDDEHLPALKALCPDLHVERIHPKVSKFLSLTGLIRREALTIAFYRSAGMRRWVQRTQAKHPLQASLVFTSAMAQYAEPLLPQTPMVVDFVDVDSCKWRDYAPAHRWPVSWIYQREADQLLRAEKAIASISTPSFFVTPVETALFQSLAPESAASIKTLSNGVDAEYFSRALDRQSPFSADEKAIVFVGAMDYWPNVDGVKWFARNVMPLVLARWPTACFHIVGRNPSKDVLALASDSVRISGTVPDVRPYLQFASAVVVPLRVARGVQNKILEAMAMAQPVITVPACAEAIGASAEEGLLQASEPSAFLASLNMLFESADAAMALGRAARAHVGWHFRWADHMKGLDACFPHTTGARA